VIRAVTLDAAGTLFAPRQPIGETYARIAGEHGIVLEPRVVDEAFRRAFGTAPPLAFPGAGPDALPALERAWWRAVVRDAFGSPAGHPRFEACFETLFAYYAQADAWALFPEVVPTLRALRDRGVRVGVVSNFDGRLPGLLEALGLASALDATVWSSAAGAAKPAREIFETAARRLGAHPSELCHVGDDLEADVRGARTVGATAIHLDRRTRRAGSLATLSGLIARLDEPGYA